MTFDAAPLRALGRLVLAALLLATLCGCSSLPFFRDKTDEAVAGRAPEPEVALFDFEVEAPSPLKKLLIDYLDLSRFRTAPKSEAITDIELDRLALAAPAQARSLLETEGYFDAAVKITRSAGTGGLTRLTMTVIPGPRVVVKSVQLDTTTPLADRRPTREQPEKDRLQSLRNRWPLPPGEPFRQADWSSAKTATLGALRADGYPKADWQQTHARIDAVANTAELSGMLEGGPLYRLGPVRVEGVHRYDEEAVRRLAAFSPGQVYTEKALLDYQDRLIKVGLFGGASVELDASGPPEAAPVIVKVKELTQHQATFGVGFSANTGPRVSVEHYDRKVFGQPWIAHTTATVGPNLKSLGTEFTSYPRENLWRDLAAANVEQLKGADETRNSWTTRIGRSKDTIDYERLYYLEASQARVLSTPLVTSSEALSAHYNWLRRDVDNVLLPTEGAALALQGGVGYGTGTLDRSDRPGIERSRGPFVRAYSRLNAYRRFGSWYANARVEAGQVFVASAISVPDTLLFRAGGDNSVRGYGYRTLGPTINGAVVGGRVLLTGSVELEHPILERLPALLGAVFVDAGSAADKWNELHPVVGVGVGVHYRSPVGPLRLDVAYGQATRQVRVHLSVGVAF